MNIHPLLKNKIHDWQQLEKQIGQLPTAKERGDVFEQFVYCYLKIKKDLYQVDELYMSEQVPILLKRKLQIEDCAQRRP